MSTADADRVPGPERRGPLEDLIGATRELMLAAGTTTADVEDLREAERLLGAATRLLGSARNDRVHRVPWTQALAEHAEHGRPTVFGSLNPLRIPVGLRIEGPRVSASWTPDALHEGPPGYVHGGFSAAILDNVLGTLVAAQGRLAYTLGLDLAFRAPTLLDVPVTIVGEIESVVGRTVTARGWLEQDGRRTVEAVGVFVEPRATT